ncbi:MAG: zinc ribbon domain-containing protein [FCB group bacterium]|nr:zinc ribbon domain-containing protein [FCB group bacterium]
MPIYEYECSNCGSDFEELVLSAEETPDCPVCESREVFKRVSAFASCGGGFYAGSGSSCGPGPFS